MAIYIPPNTRKLDIKESDRYNEPVILTGIDESFTVINGVFFIESLRAVAGTTVAINDGAGTAMIPAVDEIDLEHSPIRCDGGVSVTGNLAYLKGFVVRNVFT